MRATWLTLLALTLLALIAAALCACIDADFERPSLVKTARVLAIVVDPPVAGVDVAPTFTATVVDEGGAALAHDPDAGVRFEWHACLVPESVPGLQGMQYDADGNQQGCGGAMAIPLSVDDNGVATMPAGLLPQLLATLSLDDVAQVLGLPTTLLMEALSRTGVIITVELRVDAVQQEPLIAFKRVVLVDREQADVIGANPPPPRLSVRQRGQASDQARWLSARMGGDPTRCTWESDTLDWIAGRDYVLDPVNLPDDDDDPDDDDESDWREHYDVIDLTGAFTTLREQPYYAWYATGGRMEHEQTTVPNDEEVWRTPSEPGQYALWLVVRDGHAGMSLCRTDVTVIAPD